MDELKNLAQNLKRLRAGKGLTQAELGLRVGLAKDTISKIELGKQENVGLKYLISICRTFEVDMERLFAKDARIISLFISDGNIQVLKEIASQILQMLAEKEKP